MPNILADSDDVGALATFIGYVRNDQGKVRGMSLEHYPGMAEQEVGKIALEAGQRWTLQVIQVIHRVGKLKPGEQIVFIGVASAHRTDAFAACEFIMDYLKTRAPFWKKELGCDGEYWVEQRQGDLERARRW